MNSQILPKPQPVPDELEKSLPARPIYPPSPKYPPLEKKD